MTKTDQLQQLWKRYEKEHNHEPAGTRPVVEWAVSAGLLELPQVDPYDTLASQMAQALRSETAIDKNGRSYRVNHAVKITKNGVQSTIWSIIDYAPKAFMERSFTLRREQIIGDCLQLRIDVDAYNERNPNNAPIQLELNFTDDVEERLAGESAA